MQSGFKPSMTASKIHGKSSQVTPFAKSGDQLHISWNIQSITGSISLKTRFVFRSPVRLEGKKVLDVNWLRMNNWRFRCRMSFAAANSIATKTNRKKNHGKLFRTLITYCHAVQELNRASRMFQTQNKKTISIIFQFAL